jgi:hypothetical protein
VATRLRSISINDSTMPNLVRDGQKECTERFLILV